MRLEGTRRKGDALRGRLTKEVLVELCRVREALESRVHETGVSAGEGERGVSEEKRLHGREETHRFESPTRPFLPPVGPGLPLVLDLVKMLERKPPPPDDEATDEAEEVVTLTDFSSVSM